MSKRKRQMTKEKIEKWIKEGRGCSRSKDYKPWIEIHDIASRGRPSRIRDWKTDRIHH